MPPGIPEGKQRSLSPYKEHKQPPSNRVLARLGRGARRVTEGSQNAARPAATAPLGQRETSVTAAEQQRSSVAPAPDVRQQVLDAIRARHAAATDPAVRLKLQGAINELQSVISASPDARPPSLPDGRPLDLNLVLDLYVYRTAYNVLKQQTADPNDFAAGLRLDIAEMNLRATELRITQLGVDPDLV